jgi:bacterial/archaeal transporter family-2 protein
LKWIYPLLALAGGVALGIQAVVNGGLGRKVGAIEGSFISFLVGTAGLFFVVLFFGKGNILAISQVPKWQLIGGLLGALSVFVIVLVVPKIGVTSVLISVIAGQILIGLIIDHFGLFGSRSIPIDYKNAIAILLLFTSLYLFNQK